MTTFQEIALLLTALWLAAVVIRFRHSTAALIAGLLVIAVYTLVSLTYHKVTLPDLGLSMPNSWLTTPAWAIAGLGLMLVYSPIADRLASRWFEKPPTLDSFRAIQQSVLNLIAGIIIAWILGGILEELIARGIVLQSIQVGLRGWLGLPIAPIAAICVAALGAGLMHLYQGPRAVVIVTQLSVLFGILFVISGNNLWTVIICHGLYDTIAFIRFATKRSKYSKPEKI